MSARIRLTLVGLLLVALMGSSYVQCTEEIHTEPAADWEDIENLELVEGDYALPPEEQEFHVPPKLAAEQFITAGQPVTEVIETFGNYQPQQQYLQPQQPYLPIQQPYVQPQQPYVQPQQSYVQPLQQQQQQYVQQPVYEPIVAPQYVPQYVPQIPALNYSTPIASSYGSSYAEVPIVGYQSPKPVPVAQYQPALALPRPSTASYTSVKQNYSAVALSGSVSPYSLVDLTPFVLASGYKSNYPSLYYYRQAPYRTCPKNVYLAAPSQRDIEQAFAWAQAQLQTFHNIEIQFINTTHHSFAARHQVFSFLSQESARMDEDGLLIELISFYLADRACMTKWDRQRYLPSLTKFVSVSQLPYAHSCAQWTQRSQLSATQRYCANARYRTFDGFCNNPYHPYWGKSNVCHIRLLQPDYADGISAPRVSYNPRAPLPNPRLVSSYVHNEVPIDGPYNLMKMQWGQFINHDITNTALSSYEGLIDCCRQPNVRGCWPIYVPPGDKFYQSHNVTCLNFIRSGVCPLCQLGPRQQTNKNTAFLDLSHVYGNTIEQAIELRLFRGGLLKYSTNKQGEIMLPVASGQDQSQCAGVCYLAGDTRVNQHPALTALHLLMLRNHNFLAQQLQLRHPTWSDDTLFQEARRINIAEYQMITYGEYLPIVFGPILSAYYKLLPASGGQYTYYEPKADPTTWNEYVTASCRFGHSQIQNTFGLYSRIMSYGNFDVKAPTFRLREWFMRPSLLNDGLLVPIINGLLGRPAANVDPWVVDDVRNHLYQSHKERSGGDLAATNIWRGRDHGIPGYVHYLEYCFNFKARSWKDLALFIPPYTLTQLRRLYKVVENVDLFTGGLSERHFPGADIGPTFACINGIQYYHLKAGDRFYFEHGNQVGSFTPIQLTELRRTTLARLLCRTARIYQAPQYAFLQPSYYNPLVNCTQLGEINFNLF